MTFSNVFCYKIKKKEKRTRIYFGSEHGLGASIGTDAINFDTKASALTEFRAHAAIHVSHSIEL